MENNFTHKNVENYLRNVEMKFQHFYRAYKKILFLLYQLCKIFHITPLKTKKLSNMVQIYFRDEWPDI